MPIGMYSWRVQPSETQKCVIFVGRRPDVETNEKIIEETTRWRKNQRKREIKNLTCIKKYRLQTTKASIYNTSTIASESVAMACFGHFQYAGLFFLNFENVSFSEDWHRLQQHIPVIGELVVGTLLARCSLCKNCVWLKAVVGDGGWLNCSPPYD